MFISHAICLCVYILNKIPTQGKESPYQGLFALAYPKIYFYGNSHPFPVTLLIYNLFLYNIYFKSYRSAVHQCQLPSIYSCHWNQLEEWGHPPKPLLTPYVPSFRGLA